MKEYIEREALIKKIFPIGVIDDGRYAIPAKAVKIAIDNAPAADVVGVVRCKDCKYFIPEHIMLDDGTTRAYTEEEKKLPLGVSGDVGINCGSRCMRHLYWEENSIPFWFQENDFCSYGERKEK
jgi:hypothetical protein